MKNKISCLFFITLFILPGFLVSVYGSQPVDHIVAIVGEDIILHSDLKKIAKIKNVNIARNPIKKKELLNDLIDESLLGQEIEKGGYEASNEDLASAIHNVLHRNNVTLPSLKNELKGKGISFEQYKVQLGHEIKRAKFFGRVIYPRIKVTKADIENHRKTMKARNKKVDDISDDIIHRMVVDSRIPEALKSYLQEVRDNTYIDIKK
jgi:peptidyl-prolyl cis-trans isomerase SurA